MASFFKRSLKKVIPHSQHRNIRSVADFSKYLFYQYAPTFSQRFMVRCFGSLKSKERFCLLPFGWHAYGLLTAAYTAKRFGYDQFTAIEFGVANGRGLRNIIKVAQAVTEETGIGIRIFGFDTGQGLPEVDDFRDHPELWATGDFPMQNMIKLQQDLEGKAELILGDIADTIEDFRDTQLTAQCPVGFVSIDLDLYTSTTNAFKLFDTDPDFFLPFTSLYFDDCVGWPEYNRFCGELLAIEEFNQMHELRKIDIDRSVRLKHPKEPAHYWFEAMYFLHVFDHKSRTATQRLTPQVIRE